MATAIRSPTSTLSDLEIRTPDEEGLKDGPSSVRTWREKAVSLSLAALLT